MGLEWRGEIQWSYTDTKWVEGSAKTVPCIRTEPWTCVRRGKNLGGEPASKYTEPKASSKRKATQDTHPTLSQSHSQGPTWSCLNPHRSFPPLGRSPALRAQRVTPAQPCLCHWLLPGRGSSQGCRGHPRQPQGLFCTWTCLGLLPCSRSSFLNHYGISFLWIWRRWGPLPQLCCITLLCLQSAITRNTVIRHKVQSLQLLGILVYWLTDRIWSRIRQIGRAL